MSISQTEHFRNDMINMLDGVITSDDMGKVLFAIDVLSNKYDFIEKEDAIAVSDERIKELAVLFLSCARQEGKSELTIKGYGYILRMFCDAMRVKALADIGAMDIRMYLLQYQRNRNVSNASLEHMRVVLSSFFGWMHRNEYISKNPFDRIDKIHNEKKTRTSICGEDVARLRNACTNDRERVIIEVLIGSGLRVSELVGLRVDDIDFRTSTGYVLGKGNKRRKVYFTPEAIVAMERYLENCTTKNRYLVVSSRGNKGVTTRTIERAIDAVVERANCRDGRKITPHVLRHTFATGLVTRGCPITSVQRMLGHSNLNTTMVYTHISDESVRYDFMRHGA